MSWRLARSLVVLRDEIDALAPNRSKEYDGTIGDELHQARKSDHNPNYLGVVCAFDATHDPAGGADMGVISVAVARSGHPALKYVIHDRRIWTPLHGWQNYSGENPHKTHMHVSVTGDYDDTRPWGIASPGAPQEPGTVIYKRTRPYMRGEKIMEIQLALGINADGIFGPATESAVIIFQREHGLKIDGRVGPQTLKALGVS